MLLVPEKEEPKFNEFLAAFGFLHKPRNAELNRETLQLNEKALRRK